MDTSDNNGKLFPVVPRFMVVGHLIGQCTGAFLCIAGLILVIFGLSGQIDWVVEAGGFSSNVKNASPGIIVLVAGLFLLWIYKPALEIRSKVSDTSGSHDVVCIGGEISPDFWSSATLKLQQDMKDRKSDVEHRITFGPEVIKRGTSDAPAHPSLTTPATKEASNSTHKSYRDEKEKTDETEI